MGRRLNVSTPTVINTELVPLDESFYLDVDGQMEQWYYDNTEQYAPNRKIIPLLLVPVISAFDKDTSTSYTPAFNTTRWFAKEWNETQGKYVENAITNQVDSGSADYVIQGNNLLVKKNVSYSHAVTIRCVATYIDPRDSGVTYTVEDSVNLTTNRTADVVFPEVDIISPSGRAYNPLVDDTNSQYDFKGVTTNNPVQPLKTDVRRYSVDVDGTEEILNSGEAVAPIMDIRYGENPTMGNQEFMYRQTAGGTLVGKSIDKAFIERIKGNTVAWNQLANGATINVSGASISDITTNGFTLTAPASSANKSARQSDVFGNISHIYYYGFDYTSTLAFSIQDMVLAYSTPEAESFSHVSQIGKPLSDRNTTFSLYLTSTTSQTWTLVVKNYIVADLTLIYGEDNEPTTAAQFEADYERWFGKPLSYEEYDEGSLRPVLMQSVKTTGFNQWDEEWENGMYDDDGNKVNSGNAIRSKNAIRVIPNTAYYATRDSVGRVMAYNEDNVCIGQLLKQNGIVQIPSDCVFIRFNTFISYGTTYNHDICINISNPSKNGTYEPYEGKVQGFDVTAIKGKLNGTGGSFTIFPDGLKKAGDVQDEIFVDGGVVKAVKRVGSVDLGSLTWYNDTTTYNGHTYHAKHAAYYLAKATNVTVKGNLICAKYATEASSNVDHPNEVYDKVCGVDDSSKFWVYDSIYNDSSLADFKAAMDGVMLYYELATPQTYVLDTITDFVWYGIKNGQEVLADTLPWYVSGQGTDNLTVDAMYGENINVVLRCKMMDGETLSPSKAYATLSWRMPDIETFVQSDNGGAVRSNTDEMSFETIVNVNGDVLSDALKQKHLAFNWKIRKNNTSTEIDKGWGHQITIDASELRNVTGMDSTLASTLVGNVVYLKGAYEEVTDGGEIVTYNGEKVYGRPID